MPALLSIDQVLEFSEIKLMTDDTPDVSDKTLTETSDKTLSPEAKRALEEAQERRARRDELEKKAKKETEIGGRSGADPVRYGDWEKGGIASDF